MDLSWIYHGSPIRVASNGHHILHGNSEAEVYVYKYISMMHRTIIYTYVNVYIYIYVYIYVYKSIYI